jgi:hypothetical protein
MYSVVQKLLDTGGKMLNIHSEVTFAPPGICASESSVMMKGSFARHNLVLVGASGQEWCRISSHYYCKRKLIISKLNQIDEEKLPDYFSYCH